MSFPEYAPKIHTARKVIEQPVWADNPAVLRLFALVFIFTRSRSVSETRSLLIRWTMFSTLRFNAVDGKINRVSHEGKYELDPKSLMPL